MFVIKHIQNIHTIPGRHPKNPLKSTKWLIGHHIRPIANDVKVEVMFNVLLRCKTAMVTACSID
jgi:hypothetical protein